MSVINPLLYNAVLVGVAAASGAGINPSGTGAAVTAANAAAAAQGVAIAAAVDAAISIDTTITTAGSPNSTTPPTTAAITNAQSSKVAAMQSIAYAAFEGQGGSTPLPAAAQAAIVAGIVAKYTAVIGAPLSLV